jgi:hypothetical protein
MIDEPLRLQATSSVALVSFNRRIFGSTKRKNEDFDSLSFPPVASSHAEICADDGQYNTTRVGG